MQCSNRLDKDRCKDWAGGMNWIDRIDLAPPCLARRPRRCGGCGSPRPCCCLLGQEGAHLTLESDALSPITEVDRMALEDYSLKKALCPPP